MSPKSTSSKSNTRKQQSVNSQNLSKSTVDNQMMGGKKIVINNNGSMIVQNKKETGDTNGVDEQKLEQMKERQGRVRMREALGFDANPDANEPAPNAKD